MLFLILAIFTFGASAQDNSRKCKVEMNGGKYKWAGIDSLSSNANSYFGFVVIRPKDVNAGFMTSLAKRLKSEYCNAEKLQVVIFDNRRYATSQSLNDYVDSKGKIVLMRGYYSFDRTTGADVLEFSSKLGRPTTEHKIDLAGGKARTDGGQGCFIIPQIRLGG